MVISDDIIRRIVNEVLLKIEEELNTKRSDLYVVLNEKWTQNHIEFYKKLEACDRYHVYTVYDESISSKPKQYENCGVLVEKNTIDLEALDNYITVFPDVPQQLIVKTALAIDDTFETKWVRNCFKKGQRIVMLTGGMESFTGKEPTKYIETIKNYYRTVLEYGVEFKKDFFENKEAATAIKTTDSSGEKVITQHDVLKLAQNGVITVGSGNIITQLARDTAERLNISIVDNNGENIY